MSTDLNSSFNEQFLNINTKLKKRFMRKPNVVEATNEFNALAIQCEHSEQPTFAGHAYIGAAKCESSAGNTLGEAENYLAAARQFMNAEIKLSSMKCYSPARENLEAAVGCYIQAINKYPEKSLLRTAALMELANNLAMLNHKLEAISYYMQALENIEENSAIQIKCLCTLLDINIQCNCLETALKIANRLSELKMRLPENVLIEIQISRILLALITEPTENDRTPSLKQLFADLLNDRDEASQYHFNTDLKLKLQSIIMCCNRKDTESLVEVSPDTSRFFTIQQQDLLIKLIRKMESDT